MGQKVCLSCSACPVLPVPFYLSCSAYSILPVLFCLSCSAVLFWMSPWLSCSASPVLLVLLCLKIVPAELCLVVRTKETLQCVRYCSIWQRHLRKWRNSLLQSSLYTLQPARRMGRGRGHPLHSTATIVTYAEIMYSHHCHSVTQYTQNSTVPIPVAVWKLSQKYWVMSPVLVFMNIVLWLKSWYLAEKPVFPPKHCRGGNMYQSPQEMETKLINVNKSCYLVLS
jgi:hypothetical protein